MTRGSLTKTKMPPFIYCKHQTVALLAICWPKSEATLIQLLLLSITRYCTATNWKKKKKIQDREWRKTFKPTFVC